MAGVMHARIRRTSSGSDKEGASPKTMLSSRQFPTMDFCSIAKWDDPKCSWMITNDPSNVGSANTNEDLISHLCGCRGWKLGYRAGVQAGRKVNNFHFTFLTGQFLINLCSRLFTCSTSVRNFWATEKQEWQTIVDFKDYVFRER